MGRDNFTIKTVDILGKRVGFLCSNPDCRRHTIGPHQEDSKATIIGVAAHITAAAPGGPRYDNTLTPDERIHINNGIWLCSNCATLIDKDSKAYPKEKLVGWKNSAEEEMLRELIGKRPETTTDSGAQEPMGIPLIEPDLIWSGSMRSPRGYSPKNREKYGGSIPVGSAPIIFWEVSWRFKFVLYNNSRHPAFNIRIEQAGGVKFDTLSSVPRVNNLPPYASLDLDAKCVMKIESDYTEAEKLMKQKIPERLNGLILNITYLDEERIEHRTVMRIHEHELNYEFEQL